jgi:hypothetical protein
MNKLSPTKRLICRPSVTVVASVISILVSPGTSASSALTSAQAATADGFGPQIKVVWFDPDDLLVDEFDLVAHEVSRLFKAVGIEVSWRRTNGRDAVQYPGEILSVLLPGGPHKWREEDCVMGAVNQRNPSALRVYYGNVLRILGLPSDAVIRSRSAAERTRIAEAVGRVLAHELIHSVDPRYPHAPQGLFRARLNKKDLTKIDIAIDSASVTALHQALSEVAPRVSRGGSATVVVE